MRLVLACTLVVAACGDNADRCVPLSQHRCGCLIGATSGIQTCGSDGTWQTCQGCPLPADAAFNSPGDASCGPGIYPCGPYGYGIGSTVANLELIGPTSASDPTPVSRKLSDLVTPGIEALMIDVCAVWCGPCNEDQPNLVTLYDSYQAGGHAQFYTVITQNSQPGGSPVIKDAENWAKTYKVPYPIALDPEALTQAYFPIAAYPEHLVIRTSDMTLVYRSVGIDTALQAQIDAVLANP
ncbi:MAG TPA: TlpA disulfide reductase family protein [Kofleriaceae bacterium]|nr:TlpA disulfide reductase family protein [Kofleriaceae bacterium]